LSETNAVSTQPKYGQEARLVAPNLSGKFSTAFAKFFGRQLIRGGCRTHHQIRNAVSVFEKFAFVKWRKQPISKSGRK
jgi:hypothetical protein